jgi:hypothetical protein
MRVAARSLARRERGGGVHHLPVLSQQKTCDFLSFSEFLTEKTWSLPAFRRNCLSFAACLLGLFFDPKMEAVCSSEAAVSLYRLQGATSHKIEFFKRKKKKRLSVICVFLQSDRLSEVSCRPYILLEGLGLRLRSSSCKTFRSREMTQANV